MQGFRPSLVQTIHEILQGTKAEVDGETVNMDIGVPQGAVLSPTLFALYINDLLVDLNINTTCYAFADDLVIVAKGEYLLDEAIRKITKWSRLNGIEINK